MEFKGLSKFGMTKTEAIVFLGLLKLKESKIGGIITKTELHRGTVYNALQSLLKKGFIVFHKEKKERYYSIKNLKQFTEIIFGKEENIKEEKEILKKLKNIFLQENLVRGEKPDIKVIVGKKGFNTFFSELYDWAHKNKKEYFFFGKGNEMIEHLGLEYYRRTQERKKLLKIKTRAILNIESKKKPVAKYVHANVKYTIFRHPSPTSTWIYGDNVAIVIWDAEPILITHISSKEVADSYKSFFEVLWNSI